MLVGFICIQPTLPGLLLVALFPKAFAGQGGAFHQHLQFGPLNAGMDALDERTLSESAVSAGQQVVPANQVGHARQALRDQFRMLDSVGGMGDDAGD